MTTPVSVALVYNHKTKHVRPVKIIWGNRSYSITRIGLHHVFRQGRTLFHVFSVETELLFFRLVLNTDSLNWTVEEISDGEPN